MTLINLDNAMSTYGAVKSVRIENPLFGGRFFETHNTESEIMAGVLAVSASNAAAVDMRSIAGVINSLFDGELTLYRAQAMINGSHLEVCNITMTIEFAVVTTGHGDIGTPHRNILLVKSMWQENMNA